MAFRELTILQAFREQTFEQINELPDERGLIRVALYFRTKVVPKSRRVVRAVEVLQPGDFHQLVQKYQLRGDLIAVNLLNLQKFGDGDHSEFKYHAGYFFGLVVQFVCDGLELTLVKLLFGAGG